VNVRAGAPAATLDPWDAQFAHAAAELGRRRAGLVADLGDRFADLAAALAPAGERFALRLVSQFDGLGHDENALLARLRERRPVEVQRGLTMVGPHRDDLRFVEVAADVVRAAAQDGAAVEADASEGGPEAGDVARDVAGETAGAVAAAIACGAVTLPAGGRDLRLFGSQGEQRAAVLALLLAEQALAAERTGELGALFLDDVMSELDDARRRLLVAILAGTGQAIITTTNRHYFTDDELAAATVIELPLAGAAGAAAS
jgi:recombinational DNA repair ATPase RecF